MPGCREEATQDGGSVCGMGWLFEVGRLVWGGSTPGTRKDPAEVTKPHTA